MARDEARATGRGERVHGTSSPARDGVEVHVPLFSSEGLARLRQLAAHDPSLLEDLQETFHRSVPEDWAGLLEAIRRGDPEATAHSAHRLAGTCRAVAALPLVLRLEMIESASKDQQMDAVEALVEEARPLLEHTTAALRADWLQLTEEGPA